jgi:hypothetical protein
MVIWCVIERAYFSTISALSRSPTICDGAGPVSARLCHRQGGDRLGVAVGGSQLGVHNQVRAIIH